MKGEMGEIKEKSEGDMRIEDNAARCMCPFFMCPFFLLAHLEGLFASVDKLVSAEFGTFHKSLMRIKRDKLRGRIKKRGGK